VSEKKDSARAAVLSSALGVINKVAIVVVGVVVVALGLGLLLDRFLGTDRLFTFLLIIASVPVTLTLIYRISMSEADKIKAMTAASKKKSEEESAE
jgi:F0F1-type ATP synthase assembly protein I